MNDPLPELSNLTATALLGWYAWHTATRTLPALVRAFREEMAAMRADSAVEREAFHSELAAERLQRHADHMAIVEGLRELAQRLPPARHNIGLYERDER